MATLEGASFTENMTSAGGLVIVLCTPDDGCCWHPKHVEWTCRIINRRLCVAWPHWREVPSQKIWPVPEAVVTVFCTPDDGCGWHPKHVEWTCRIINRLLCVESRWTIVNILITAAHTKHQNMPSYKHRNDQEFYCPLLQKTSDIYFYLSRRIPYWFLQLVPGCH